MSTSIQSKPNAAALDSLTSRLRNGPGLGRGSGLPPLGSRTVGGSEGSPPSAHQPAPPTSNGSFSSSSSADTSAATTASASSAPTPIPPLAPLPAPRPCSAEEISKMAFSPPKKRIVSQKHLEKWQHSAAFDEVLGLIMYCNDAIVGRKLTDAHIPGQESEAVQSILSILDRVAALVKETPAETETTSRFGNPAFRTFYAKVSKESGNLHGTIIKGDLPSESIIEVERYFIECFGNEKRIDYGSGMELNFACWLLCLVKLGVLHLELEAPAIVLKIFWSYINVMREIQSTYWLEPAGSHGVWGLDDYHFLPFLFGSSQLKDHKHLKPKAIHNQEILDEFYPQYMYFACIRFINSIKTASLRWHSPMLDDISGVRTWAKVNEGMMKMYKAEVLLKLPIAQHIFFGSLIAFPPVDDEERDEEGRGLRSLEATAEEDEHGHVHAHGVGQEAGWGDCCGIPIPSAFAAAQEEKSKQMGVRRIPFD